MSASLLDIKPTSPPSEPSRPIHIRDPSFAYDSETVFEVQSTKLPTIPCLPNTFYTGASLNSSQVLSAAHSVFPVNSQEEQRDAVLCSSDFGRRTEDPKPHRAPTKQPTAMVLGSSVIHAPDFPEEERKGSHFRTGLLQRYGRLKKASDGGEERFRGLSSPHYERTSIPRKVLTPHNKSSQRPQAKKSKVKPSSPFDTSLQTAYLPSLKTLDQKRIAAKKSARSPVVRRIKAFTPETRLIAHIE